MNWEKFAHIMTPHFLRKNESGNETTFLDLMKVGPVTLGQKERIVDWNANESYVTGDRVYFKFGVFKALQGNTGEMPIVDNQINVDGNGDAFWQELNFKTFHNIEQKAIFDQTFSSQVIYLEHALNALFNNNSADPYSTNSYLAQGKSIYIQQPIALFPFYVFQKSEHPVFPGDEVWLYPVWLNSVTYQSGDYAAAGTIGGENIYVSIVNNNQGNHPATSPLYWDFVEEIVYLEQKSAVRGSNQFTIFVPVEVKNSLQPLTSNWKDIIGDRVDFYNYAKISYTIMTY